MITSKAERETRKAIRNFRKLYPKAKIVVLGCAVTAKDKFKINLPEADLLISNIEKPKATQIIVDLLNKHGKTAGFATNNDMLLCDRIAACHLPGSDYEESGRKFIKIQDGCSNCCAFCVTTHLRGEPRSEEPGKLIKLISELVNSGIKEIVLTGINIGLYGIDLQPRTSIWSLVNRILKETKIERLTLSTVYPEMLWDKGSDPVKGRTLVECIRSPRLTKCFHLALQSGSPTVLKRMNRPTDLKKLLNAINEIRKIQPDFTFRADIIAGFPNETEDEHQETLRFIKKAQISYAHVFPYSPRVGTVSYEMIQKKKWHDLPMEVKRRRAREIRELVGRLGGKLGGEMIGKIYRVLIVRDVEGGWEGITENGWNILAQNSKCKVQSQVQSSKSKIPAKGSFVEIKITGYEEGQLLGEIISLPI